MACPTCMRLLTRRCLTSQPCLPFCPCAGPRAGSGLLPLHGLQRVHEPGAFQQAPLRGAVAGWHLPRLLRPPVRVQAPRQGLRWARWARWGLGPSTHAARAAGGQMPLSSRQGRKHQRDAMPVRLVDHLALLPSAPLCAWVLTGRHPPPTRHPAGGPLRPLHALPLLCRLHPVFFHLPRLLQEPGGHDGLLEHD